MERACVLCNVPKSLDDFYRNPTCKDGHARQCKLCYSAKAKDYYQKNKERYQSRYQENKAALNRYYTLKKTNPQILLGKTERSRINRSKRRRLADRKRYAQKKRAAKNDLTKAQWLEIQEMQRHRCYYCGKRCRGRLTKDHLTPFAKGGSHTLHNVIACCGSCNSRKRDRAVLIPVQPLLLTMAK